MKKLFVAALLSIASMGLVACGGSDAPSTPEQPARKGYFITGPGCVKVNGKTAVESGGGEWGYGGDAFELKEITLAQAKEIDSEVGGKLEEKGNLVKKIYSISGVEVGVESVGWSSRLLLNDVLYDADGSYCLKVIECEFSKELGKMATKAWTPDPHTAHVENLKNYFCPTWQEEKDEYGFAWDQNPVVSAGAGIYTVIFAEYNDVATKNTFNYGTAFVKTEDKEGQEYEEVTEWVPEDHTYGVIGSFAESGWTTDVAMQEVSGIWGTVVSLAADDEFKVRADGEWTYSWGSAAVINQAGMADNFDFGAENIKVKVSGTYGVAIQFDESGNGQITLGIAN